MGFEARGLGFAFNVERDTSSAESPDFVVEIPPEHEIGTAAAVTDTDQETGMRKGAQYSSYGIVALQRAVSPDSNPSENRGLSQFTHTVAVAVAPPSSVSTCSE